MADKPAAEVEVDAALVARLLAEQMPDLSALAITPVVQGWDNAVFRLGDELAVRVPRRAVAAGLIHSEQRWLSEIATRVDVAVPVPLRRGTPTAFFPWHWSVVPWFTGQEAGSTPIAERAGIAAPLAAFVAQMHVPAPAEAPHNPVRGIPLHLRDATVRDRLASGLIPREDEVAGLWARALAAPVWAGARLWLHGDLHPFNVLVLAAGTGGAGGAGGAGGLALAAVVDFGDLTAGDPACDLATAWLTFDAPGRAIFRAEVESRRAVEESTWLRARGWALIMATAMLAHSDDDPTFARLGAQTLDQVLSGD